MKDMLECTDCSRCTFYEKRRCHNCGNDEFRERDPGTGELLAVTTIYVTPDDVREPNLLGLARFDKDTNVIAQLGDDLTIGDAVRLDGPYSLREGDGYVHNGLRLVAIE